MAIQGEQLYGTYRCPVCGHREEVQMRPAENARLIEAAEGKAKKGDLDKLEKRHKREQRRVRTDELRSGLGVLVSRYRDAMASGGSADDFVAAAAKVQDVADSLVFNVKESLALQALFVSLPRLP